MACTHAGKVYVVTGSGSGMGYATAVSLLKQGALLRLCDINEEALSKFVEDTVHSKKDDVMTGKVNIADRSSLASFIQSTKEKFGTAGHKLGHQEVWEISDAEYDFIMDINVRGLFNVLAEGLKPGVLADKGSIVHTASMFSERGFAKGALYSASKHASIGMVKSAAIEGGKGGIHVNSILPGPIDTAMLRANEASGAEGTSPEVPLGRLGTAEEVASVAAFLLSDDASYVTGAVWGVDGVANA